MTPLTGCDLHLHLMGAYTAEDFLELGAGIYQEVNWAWNDFLNIFRQEIDPTFDPTQLFELAMRNPDHALQKVREIYLFHGDEPADFYRFVWKFRLFSRIWGTYWDQRSLETSGRIIGRVVERHKNEGMRYVEYRIGLWGTEQEHVARLKTVLETLDAYSDERFEPKLIISIPRNDTEERWRIIQHLLQRHTELSRHLVGVDFAAVEEGFPPKHHLSFFRKLHWHNHQNRQHRLDAVYHVGESYFDKSVESAVRWCHQAALLGAKRLGHCIALGMDPAVSTGRKRSAHEAEPVSERLDQIRYDLAYHRELGRYGIEIDCRKLKDEALALRKRERDAMVERRYTRSRLADIRRRQRFVLDQLTLRGTVIESCPTSNLRIGGVPEPKYHPVFAFLDHNVNLAICTDDPGIFDISLRSEIDWVVQHSGRSAAAIEKRLGDPYRFRLGQS